MRRVAGKLLHKILANAGGKAAVFFLEQEKYAETLVNYLEFNVNGANICEYNT